MMMVCHNILLLHNLLVPTYIVFLLLIAIKTRAAAVMTWQFSNLIMNIQEAYAHADDLNLPPKMLTALVVIRCQIMATAFFFIATQHVELM